MKKIVYFLLSPSEYEEKNEKIRSKIYEMSQLWLREC